MDVMNAPSVVTTAVSGRVEKKRGWFETTSRIYEGVPKIVKTQYWNIGDVIIEEKQNYLLL